MNDIPINWFKVPLQYTKGEYYDAEPDNPSSFNIVPREKCMSQSRHSSLGAKK